MLSVIIPAYNEELMIEKAENAFNECGKQLRETQTAFSNMSNAFSLSDNCL